MVDGGGADSIHRFRLERGCDRMKRYRKMECRLRVRLGSMKWKRDTVNLTRAKNDENLCG
jgi:hypothetical protein